MRTVLRKLFGASIGGGAAQSFFVFALTALIAGAPLAARAQDSAVVGTVTLRAGETLTLSCTKASDNDGNFGAGFSSLTFVGPAVSTATVGRPDFTGARLDWSNWSKFTVVPANLYGFNGGAEGELTLGAISVMWGEEDSRYTDDIADAQHVVLVDADGNVVAVSEAPDVTPALASVTSTYRFAGTTLDAAATYTGYFVEDATTVTVGEPWAGTGELVRTRVFVAPSEHTDCYVTDNKTWLAPIGFAFGSGDVDAMEWTATPWFTAGSSVDKGAYAKFGVCFRWMWQGARFPWPNDFILRSVSVPFVTGHADGNNASVRRLVLTDSSNTVVALSERLAEAPSSDPADPAVFTFTGVTLSPAETYSGYFVGEEYPDLGQTYTASPLGQVRYQTRSQPSNAGCFVGTVTSHAPNFSFEVAASEVEQSLGALNINFDREANRLDADTSYGLDGVQYPGSQWNTLTTVSNGSEASGLSVTDTVGHSLTVSYFGKGFETFGNADYNPLLKTVLMDGGGDSGNAENPYVQIERIPYATYDAYIYIASNYADGASYFSNAAVQVNDGAYYTMAADQETATVVDAPANGVWAVGQDPRQVALGVTVMRIANLSGETLKLQAMHRSGGRGNIAAIQIVELRTAPVPTHWEGTIEAASQASTLMVSNGITEKALSLLTETDSVELAFDGQVSLTVDAPVTVASLTLDGADGATLTMNSTSPITAGEIAIDGGTVITAEGIFVSEAPIDLAQRAILQIQGANGAAFTQAVTGAGAVRIWSGSDVTLSAAFTHTGGTTVATDGGTETITTTLRYAGQPLGEGPVTVGAGGVFDLCGLACDQDIALNGGTLANTGRVGSDSFVASVNFETNRGQVADDATGGLQEMLGTYWTNTDGGTGTVVPNFVNLADITTSGATPAPIEGLQVAWSAGTYQDGANNTSFLKGYLDDNNQRTDYFASKATVTVPENVARCGYDLYLYYSSDAGNYGFAPVPVRANGVVTHYTYENGEVAVAAAPALTATAENVAHWGSLSEGRNTVAEGTNVMVLRGRTETQLEIGLPSYGNPDAGADRARGCIAAIQIATGTMVCGYSGTLTVGGTGTLNAAADTTFSGTLAGAGTLTKVGDGALSVTGATATAGTTLAATAGGLTFGEGNDLSGLTLDLGVEASVEAGIPAFTLGALTGAGAFDLGGVTSLTFAGAAAEAVYTGALSAGGALSLVKQGTNTQRLDNLAGVDALAVTAEAGTLVLGADVPALTDLETRGGTVSGLPATVGYAEMAEGAATAATAATASAARPAAETATAATVSNFTLAQDGEIRYLTAADFDKWFPEGFLVSGRTYRLVLGPDLADAAPVRFTVLGAPKDITLVPYREGPDGPVEIASGVSITDGTTVYIDSAAAIVGDLSTLPAKYHHYPFTGNVNDAVTGGNNLNAEGATYTDVDIDNGQALSGGTPWSYTNLVFNPDGDSWTLGLYLNVAETDPSSLLLHVGTANGSNAGGALILATGAEPGTLRLWRKHETENVYNELATVDLGLGGATAWHHLLVTHSATVYQVYVDGELAARVEGDFSERAAQIQVGKGLDGLTVAGIANGAGRFLLDDLAVWSSVLREGQIDLALAEVAGTWRWNEAKTPAELFAADAQWTDASGAVAAWPTDGTYTARATLTRTADVADLVDALDGFTARWILLEGEPLTLTITDTAVDFPESAGTIVLDNDLTLDLSGMSYDFFAQSFSTDGVRLAGGVWNGEVTISGAPAGYNVDLEVREDGLYLRCERYTRAVASVNFNANGQRGSPAPGDAAQVGATEIAGLVEMLGEHWTATTGGVGSVSPNFVDYANRTVTGADKAPIEGVTVAWNVGSDNGVWSYADNDTSYLKGYLDDTTSGDAFSRSITLTVPADVAPLGYDVYLYFASDSAGEDHFGKFSPVSVRAGSGAATTIYSYVNGALAPVASASRDTAWGSIRDGLRTVDEGTNVMVLRGRTEETLQISIHGYGSGNSPSDGPRGSIAALQIVRNGVDSAYTRNVTENAAAWTETDAWTKMDDGTKADAPEADAQVTIGIAGDTTLDMGDLTQLTLNAIETYGEGILTLTFDGDLVADAIADAALSEGETYALVNATLDPDKVRVRVTPPDSGAAIVVTVTATGATATAIAPVGNVYRATVSGSTDWQAIEWTPEGAPTADDTAILTLEDDADLIGAGQVAMLQVYAGGHAVSRASTITAGAWHFLEDATLAVKQGQALPDFATVPKRVRYDYAYAQDYTITDAYETEFAAGFTGNLNTDGNGLIEFSHGDVSIGTYGDTQNASFSTVIFSGDARLTMTGEANANGLKIGNSTVTFRDRATASLSRIHMRSKGTCVSTLIVEDDAAVTLTGAVNGVSNHNTLQLADWTGTGYLIFRDNARFTAAGADMMLCSDGDSSRVNTVTIEDNAEVRVKGIARRSTSAGVIDLRGGRLLIGDRGFQAYSNTASTITLNFAGGAFGAWEDVTLGTDAANVCQTVTGDPVLLSTDGATLTLADGTNFFVTALDLTVREGTVRGEVATLPNLRLEGGTFVVGAAAQVPTIDLRGGGLTFDGGVLTLLDDLRSEPGSVITLPFLESGTGGHPVMDGGRPLPDLSNVRFVLALDPNRDTEAGLPYQAPLFIGGADVAAAPVIAGFELRNNTNAAVSHVEPIHAAGSLGLGLYAQLEGQAILTPHTQYLPYTFIDQAAANGHAYWIFQAQADGAALTLPEGGIALRHAVFDGGLAGHSAAIKAAGSEPGLLLQAQSVTVNTDLDFDLTAWTAALDGFVRGAVRGVPSSLCLVSAGVSVNDARLTASGVPEVPGVTTEVVATTDGIYLVATADRRTRTVSVNFTTRGLPLSGTPAAPGAYALPIAAWNDLQGATSSADLRVSDVGGVASAHALRGAGDATLPTQVNAYAADFVTDAGAPTPMLQAWLTDAAATSLRLVNLPFARYRLALVFSNDLEDAAYATITIGGDVYAMDAEGYTRKNVSGYGERIPGDDVWGSTDRPAAAAPFVLGHNVLVTDVRDDASLTLSFPAAVYGRTYAGLAAIQVLEVPETEVAEEGVDYAYAFSAAETDVALMDLGLTVEGADAPQTWANGPANTLTLDVPAGVDVTLTLPAGFEADRIRASGDGALTLQVAQDGGVDSGAALDTLDATGLASLTVRFPCVGVAFAPATGLSRFEDAFDNQGEPYLIADGATLALGEDSGVAVSLNGSLDRTDGTVTLTVDTDSTGVLRRDYPITVATDTMNNAVFDGMTLAFKQVTFASGTHYVRPNFLIEEGDTWDATAASIWPNTVGGTHTLTQTGGELVFNVTGGDRGYLVGSGNTNVVDADIFLSGGRLQGRQFVSWAQNSHLDITVSGTGVLAVGVGSGTDPNISGNSLAGSFGANSATNNSWVNSLPVTISDGGTLEPIADTLAKYGLGTTTVTFGENSNLVFGADTPTTVDMTLPVTFAGTAETPTVIDPGAHGTLVLNAANTAADTAAIDLPQGTVALANAEGLGNATVTVADGAAFEARGFTGEGEGSEEARTVPVVAIKLDIPAGVGNSDGTAIQEFCLYQGDDKVEWPSGTTISGTGRNNTPNWTEGGNEAINALIDSVTGGVASPGTWTKPEDGSTGAYTGNAKNNKWYPITNTTGTASATITIGGDGVVFDSYTLWCSDSQSRFPSAWTLSVRYEGDAEDSWTVLHAPTGQNRPAANTESNKYRVTLRTEGGATTLDDVTGRVVFQAGSQCRAVSTGTVRYPYVARIAGSIEVGADVRFFLDGTEYTVTADDIDEARGLVTFGQDAQVATDAVTWDVANATGTWQDGEAGPWVGGVPFFNGAAVTFPDAAQRVTVSVAGAPRPGALTLGSTDGDYTFVESAPDAGDRIDLSALAAETSTAVDAAEDANDITVRTLDLGAGVTYDVPLETGSADRGIDLVNGTIRLAGVLSLDGKTATLVGSGNINAVGASPHGAWLNETNITLAPHAGERQILSAAPAHLRGAGVVTVTGQVAEDGSVSGGTVEFGGTSSTGGNNAFSGTFEIRDGATLDFTMTRSEGGDNPYFLAADGTPLYKDGNVGFTLRNGGVLRFSGHRGFLGGWGQISNSTPDLWTSQPITIGYRSALECVYGSGTYWQHTPYGLFFNGDGATLTIDDGSASGLGVDFVRGATLTVAGVGDAGDPADPKVDATPDSETIGLLTEGITATIQTVEGATMRIFGDGGQDDALFLDVHEGSTLRVAADLGSTTPDGTNQTDPAPFVKQGTGRMTLEWPECTNLVEVEVEEGALGGTAALTHDESLVTIEAGAAIEAGLTVTNLALVPGSTLLVDPTGTLQLRAVNATLQNGGAYVVDALSADIPEAGDEPVKVVSWSNAPEAVNAAFQPSDALRAAGYGVEVRDDGLYLKRAVTYILELTGLETQSEGFRFNWDSRSWYTSLEDYLAKRNAGPFNPPEGATADVTLVIPGEVTAAPVVTAFLGGPVEFSSLRFATLVDDGLGGQTLATANAGGLVFNYRLANETPPAERETKVYTWLPTLIYTTPAGPAAARLTATPPEGCYYLVDGTSVIVYRDAAGRAINVTFAGGVEGSPSWLPSDAAPCGPVPFAGVYWNNVRVGGSGTNITPGGSELTVYNVPITVSGMATENGAPTTATLTYAYSGVTTLNNRSATGDERLAATFLPGGNHAIPSGAGTLENPGTTSGWAVRVDQVPFTHYDLYLLFAGTDAADSYPAVRIRVGDQPWRTYSFLNGWTAPSANADAWAGVGFNGPDGFVQGLNLLHLRVEANENASIQIVPCDGGNGNATDAGLAGLQIVALEDDAPVYYRFSGTRWGDATAWLRNGTTRSAWDDATLDAPHYASFEDTANTLQVDRTAALPFLRFEGLGSLTVRGEPGALSAASLDFTSATSGTAVFEEDVFAHTPAVLLGPGITLQLPESDAGLVDNDWRWVYEATDSTSSTIHKTKAGELRLTRTVDSNLRIDNGTLWLTSVTNGGANYPRAISGEGTLGWAGTGAFRVAFNNLPTGDNDPENAFLRVSSGTVTMAAVADSSLPADRKVIVSDGATLQFNNNDRGVNQRPFPNGTFLARDGGIVHYNGSDASNTFKNNAAVTQLPSVRLESGMFQQTVYTQIGGGNNASVHDVYEFVSSGDSRYYVANAGSNAWNHKALNVRSGRIQVEAGTLGIHSSLGNGTGSKNSVVLFPNADLAAEYGDSDSTHGYLDVATGAVLLSHYPIYAGSSGSNNTLAKVGGGVWVQTQNVCQTVGYNGGGNANTGGTDPYCNIEIREGTFRLNMGDDVLEVPADTAARTITLQDGTRMEGTGTVSDDFDVTIATSATLLSGFPADVTWVTTDSQWYDNYPGHFKRAADRSDTNIPEGGSAVGLLFQGDLTFEDGAILEVNLAANNPLSVIGDAASVSFRGTLNVRLLNVPLSLAEPVRLTNFGGTVGEPGDIVCPEAVSIDAEVKLCTAAEVGVAGDDSTAKNLWLIPSGVSHRWTDKNGKWSDAGWTQGEKVDAEIPDGNAVGLSGDTPKPANPETSPTARVEAATADVTLTVDAPRPGSESSFNETDYWGVYGLILAADTGRSVILNQDGVLTLTENAGVETVEGTLHGLTLGTTLWKIGAGRATVDAVLSALTDTVTFNVSDGALTLRRPLLRIEDLARGTYSADFGGPVEIAEGATLTLDFTLPEDEAARDARTAYYRDILVIEPDSIGLGDNVEPAQAQLLSGALTGAGTLAVNGSGTALRLTGTADSGVDYAVDAGATLILAGNQAGGAAADSRSATVAAGGVLDLATEAALGAADWDLTLGAAPADETTGVSGGALVRTSDRNARLRGAVTVTGSGTATLGTMGLDIDGALTVSVPTGATLDLAATNVMTSEDAADDAAFVKTGTGLLAVTSSNFELGLPVEVREGTLRFTATSVLPTPPDDRTVDWTVREGAVLSLAGDNVLNLNFEGYGALTVESGATLALDGRSGATVNNGSDNPVTFAGGATVRFGNGTDLPLAVGTNTRLYFPNPVRVEGVVTVDVAVDPASLPEGDSITLMTFASRSGAGSFVLGGETAALLAARGWTLRDNTTSVVLEPFGTGTVYTWAADNHAGSDPNAWSGDNWRSSAEAGDTLVAWPAEFSTPPTVVFPEVSPVSGDPVPSAFRTVEWEGEAQTLAALRADNAALDGQGNGGDYVLRGNAGLTLNGVLLKTNGGGLTFERAVTFDSIVGAISHFGGALTFAKDVTLNGVPISLYGEGTVLAFAGDTEVTVNGRLGGDGQATVRKAGAGTLTFASDAFAVKGFSVESGTLSLTADNQAEALAGEGAPTFDVAPGATLVLGGAVGTGVVAPAFAEGNTGVTLRWEGAASSATAAAPALGALPAVGSLVYAPASGHLILDPGSLPDTATLTLEAPDADRASETLALWLGAGEDADGTLTLAGLNAAQGAVIGVEPVIDTLAAGDWATDRVIDLAVPAAEGDAPIVCGATFMGGVSGGQAIRSGLSVRSTSDARVTLNYVGTSDHERLGTLTAGKNARVEVTGGWLGTARAIAGGVLAGDGTLGDVDIPVGGRLSATVTDVTDAVVPAELTVQGELTLRTGSGLEVAATVDAETGATAVSCVQSAAINLEPPAADNEVMIDVYLDADPTAAVNNKKIVGWETLNGATDVSGTVYVRDETGAWVASDDYVLHQSADGLYLRRNAGRFWMILR